MDSRAASYLTSSEGTSDGFLPERNSIVVARAVSAGGAVVEARHGFSEQQLLSRHKDAGVMYTLAKVLAREAYDIDTRVYLLDNSGSTSTADGHVIARSGANGVYTSTRSTRWDEVRCVALDQANWGAQVGVRCEFWLLNPPCPSQPLEGRDYTVVDSAQGQSAAQLEALERLLEKNGPRGPTPLVCRMQEVRRRLQRSLAVAGGKKVVLTIVTDGMPTSPNSGTSTSRDRMEFAHELRTFAMSFNCSVVIRLTTDEEAVVNFYNDIDGELEVPLDILDDLAGEAQEVYRSGNGWLTYSPLIHRIREAGTSEKIFDLLDERCLNEVEIATFLEFLFRDQHDPPFPRDPKGLLEAVDGALGTMAPVFDGRRSRMAPPVNRELLRKALSGPKRCAVCVLM